MPKFQAAKMVGCDGRVNYHGEMRRALVSLLVLACSVKLGCAASNTEAAEPTGPSTDPSHDSNDANDHATPPSSTQPADKRDAPEPSEQRSAAQPVVEPANEAAPPSDKRETRTKEVITATVLEKRQNVRDCYEIARQDEPTLQGTLTVHFEIDPKGRVSVAKLNEERSTLKDPSLVTCALDAFKAIRFPPSSRGYESVGNYPFDFRP